MNRTDIILELAKYCHPSTYQKVLNWKTEHLEALLKYYQNFKPTEKRPDVVIVIGIDSEVEEDGARTFPWPFKYGVDKSEPLKNKQKF